MKYFIGILIVLSISITTVFPQNIKEDAITKIVRRLFSYEQSFDRGFAYQAWCRSWNFIGATLSKDSTLDITLTYDEKYHNYIMYQSVPIKNYYHMVSFNAILNNARLIQKKVETFRRIRIFFVLFSDVRDRYGNLEKNEKTIICKVELLKVSIDKMNWKYIDQLLHDTFMTGSNIEPFTTLLDDFYFNPQLTH